MKKIFTLFFIAIIIFILFYIFNNLEKESKISDKQNTFNELAENININNNSDYYNSKKINLRLIEEEYKGYDTIAKIFIPKINLETYVLKNYSTDSLKISVTKFWGANPNEVGNFCIAGHNYREFKNITDLEIGDYLTLVDNYNGEIQYVIYDIFKVYPSQTDCLSQDTNGNREITLITCTQNSQKRIIVKARENT